MWYQLTQEEVQRKLSSSDEGLSARQVEEVRNSAGRNLLKEAPQKSKLAIFFSQFKDVMIVILTIAAAISFFVGENTDAYVILAIVAGNALIGYSEESKAERSVRMLQKMAAPFAMVVRDGGETRIAAEDLVPGDLILLEAGDIVPADARLTTVNSLKVDEAALTGESHTVEKISDRLPQEKLGPADQLNMVFKGTIVSNGSAKAIVVAIGMDTEIGKIAGMLDPGPQSTPLQKRLATFSKQLAAVVIVICIVVFGLGILRGEPIFNMFLTALSLAVAALPEALPAVITIALAQGAQRMVKQKALIRKLPAVETLGSVTYICSDKTGTLTQNVMTVEKVEVAPEREALLKQAMLLNNEVRFGKDGSLIGDSTETAFVTYALENGLVKSKSEDEYPLLGKVPFDSVRMRMSTVHKHKEGWLIFVKGAPAKIVEVLSDEYRDRAQQLLDRNREWAREGMRVLFFAYKEFDAEPREVGEHLEHDLRFLGMAAMIDPPRDEVINAIRQCKTAGIRTVMITGDQALTARAIAHRLEITQTDTDVAITGADLHGLDEPALQLRVGKAAVYARVSPEQKLNIVRALQRNGEFVAMTGDGVNDAPALKQADIGVAMGITGTDVSKESADMILLDDNFATIVKAVKEGRRIYENIRKFIVYVLSCNLAEILVIIFAPILGFAIPLLPIHILWINLVTDGLPGIALVGEAAEKDIMRQPPRPPSEKLFAGGLTRRIILGGFIMASAAIITQWWATESAYSTATQQTMVFTVLCFVQLGNALSVRSFYHSMLSADLFSNKGMWGAVSLTVVLQVLIVWVTPLQSIFKTTPLDWGGIKMIAAVTLGSLLALEAIKYFTTRKRQL